MTSHESLQAIGTILTVRMGLIGTVYILFPQRLYVYSVLLTIGTICISTLYFLYKKGVGKATATQIPPALEVRVGKGSSAPTSDPVYRMIEAIYGKKPTAIDSQFLWVKVLRAPIASLGAKVWLDGDGPTYLKWPTTEKTIEPSTGKVAISESPKFMDFVPEQQEVLIVWMAFRDANGEYLRLHTDASLGLLDLRKLSDSQGRINVDIQFIGENYTDPSPRRFRINAKSWGDLNLTERD